MEDLSNQDLIAVFSTIRFRINDIERRLRKNKNITKHYADKLDEDLKYHEGLCEIFHSKVEQNIKDKFKDVQGTPLAIWIQGADIGIRLWNALHDYLKDHLYYPVEYFDNKDRLYHLPNVGKKGIEEFELARENYPSYDINYFEISRWLEA